MSRAPGALDRSSRIETDLKTLGIHQSRFETLFRSPASAVELDLARATLNGVSEAFLSPVEHRSIFLDALDRGFLAVVERYLGEPPALIAAHLRSDRGSAVTADLTHWHLDAEDPKMLRVIVYLCEVDRGNGAFEYIPASLGARCESLKAVASGDLTSNPSYDAVTDEAMAQVVPMSDWCSVAGPSSTAVVVDTARLFHRTRPHLARRDSLTLTYTSRSPRFPRITRDRSLDSFLAPDQSAAHFRIDEVQVV